jgi:catechol 2,3-dioxygenase-like lactoylglutathione lyase family enzyme
MKPRTVVLTLGVDDLDVAVSFYRDGLGLRTEGIVGTEFEHGAVALPAAGTPPRPGGLAA